VPGVLQKEHYARTVIQGNGSLAGDEIELRVRARPGRQSLPFNRVDLPRFTFRIDEDALNRPIDPDIMRDEPRHLDDVTTLDHVALRIVPARQVCTKDSQGSRPWTPYQSQRFQRTHERTAGSLRCTTPSHKKWTATSQRSTASGRDPSLGMQRGHSSLNTWGT